jgi:hypothetical protein
MIEPKISVIHRDFHGYEDVFYTADGSSRVLRNVGNHLSEIWFHTNKIIKMILFIRIFSVFMFRTLFTKLTFYKLFKTV